MRRLLALVLTLVVLTACEKDPVSPKVPPAAPPDGTTPPRAPVCGALKCPR